jgi:hypothetical protein
MAEPVRVAVSQVGDDLVVGVRGEKVGIAELRAGGRFDRTSSEVLDFVGARYSDLGQALSEGVVYQVSLPIERELLEVVLRTSIRNRVYGRLLFELCVARGLALEDWALQAQPGGLLLAATDGSFEVAHVDPSWWQVDDPEDAVRIANDLAARTMLPPRWGLTGFGSL